MKVNLANRFAWIKTIMFKQNLLGKNISSLNLNSSELYKKLSDIINNTDATQTDIDQIKLSENHILAWKSGKAIPTNPIVREAILEVYTKCKGENNINNFFDLVLDEKGAKQLLDEALEKYNHIIINNLQEVRYRALNFTFDHIKHNPFPYRVNSVDIMGCIAYLVISSHVYLRLKIKKNQRLDAKLYNKLIKLDELSKLVDPKSLLLFLQKELQKKKRINTATLHRESLLYLLLVIKGDDFFKE